MFFRDDDEAEMVAILIDAERRRVGALVAAARAAATQLPRGSAAREALISCANDASHASAVLRAELAGAFLPADADDDEEEDDAIAAYLASRRGDPENEGPAVLSVSLTLGAEVDE